MRPENSSSPTLPAAAPCWTNVRMELCSWMRRNNAASLAELYEGAVLLLFYAPLPGRVRFVAHAVREIRNRLPEIISGVRASGTLQYKNKLDVIAKRWKKSGFRLDGSFDMGFETTDNALPPPDIPIQRDLFLAIAGLLKENEEIGSKKLDTAYRLFETVAPENQTIRDTLRPNVDQWLEITEWFMKKTHDSGYVDADINDKELSANFELFETCLNALVRGFFNTVDELDAILEDANS